MKTQIAVILLLGASCGDSPSKAADGPPSSPDAMPLPDSAPVNLCPIYPLIYQADPDAKAACEMSLDALSPGYSLTWEDVLGTPDLIGSLDVAILPCANGENLNDYIKGLIDSYPEVFRADSSEWDLSANVPCQVVTTPRIVTVRRKTIGTEDVRRDTLAFAFRRRDGKVTLTAVTGTYLPDLSADMEMAMADCPTISIQEATAQVTGQSFDYTTFSQCMFTGSGSYTAGPADTVFFDGAPYWSWHEDAGEVVLQKLQLAHLIVAPSNVTSELLASNANCPDNTNTPVLGFTLLFDAVTGDLVSSTPGVGCIVC